MVNKKRGGLKLEINLTNRWLYTLIVLFSFAIIGTVVYAQNPDVFGHQYEDLDLGPVSISENSFSASPSGTISLAPGSGSDLFVTLGTDSKMNIGSLLIHPNRNITNVKSLELSENLCLSGVCKSSWPESGTSLWSESGGDVYRSSGNVGIGTIDPATMLHVDGDLIANGTIHAGWGDVLEVGDYSNKKVIQSGWTSGVGDWIKLSVPGNNGAADVITMVQGGKVGIGTTTPGAKLDVDGNVIASTPTASNHLATKGYVDDNTGDSGSSISPRGVFDKGLIDCEGGIDVESSSSGTYRCNNPRLTLLHTSQSDYDNLFYNDENEVIAIDALTVGAVCTSLGMKYESTGSSYDNIDWNYDSNADVMAWTNSNGWHDVGDNDYINWVICKLPS